MTPDDTPVGGDRDAVAEALKQLDKAADQFAYYADQHAAKRTPEAETKARVNHQWALACARHAHAARKAHEAAEARVKELEAALAPFRATLASINQGEAVADATPLDHPALWSHDQPTLGDLRRLCALPPAPEVPRA